MCHECDSASRRLAEAKLLRMEAQSMAPWPALLTRVFHPAHGNDDRITELVRQLGEME